jgi:hypothetical protein
MMVMKRFLVLVVLGLSPVAPAEDVLRLDAVPAPPARPFAQGTWTLQTEGSYTAPIRYSDANHVTASVGIGYYLWDDSAITVLAHGFHVNQPGDDDDTGAFGVSVMGRTHLLHLDRFTLYIDGGGGYAWANEAFPVGGTTYNFTARVGPGISYRLTDRAHLIAGARYFHNSNAKAHGHDKNPGYDGIEAYVGLLFTLR